MFGDFKDKVAQIIQRKLEEDPKILDMSDDALLEELMDEVQRYALPTNVDIAPNETHPNTSSFPVIARSIDKNTMLGQKSSMNQKIVPMLNDIMSRNEKFQGSKAPNRQSLLSLTDENVLRGFRTGEWLEQCWS